MAHSVKVKTVQCINYNWI